MNLKETAKKILRAFGYELMPAYSEGVTVRQLRNFRHYSRAFDRIRQVPGAVVECGVGKGRSLLYFSYIVQFEGSSRRIWGFDSFEGFPEPKPEDESKRKPKKGDWSGIAPDFILGKLNTAGIRPEWVRDNIRLEKGFFDQTLSRYDQSPIALLHIDADLYDSYKIVLEKLFPYVVSGGIVLLDEYGEENWPGATQAVDEFLKTRAYTLERDVESKKYYFVKS